MLTTEKPRPRRLRTLVTMLVAATLCAVVALATAGPVQADPAARAIPHTTFTLTTRVVASTPSAGGQRLAVKIGDVMHRAPDRYPARCQLQVWILELDRRTLEPLDSTQHPLCTSGQTTALAKAITSIPDGRIVVVNTQNDVPPDGVWPMKALSEALSTLGGPQNTLDSTDLNVTAVSLFGIKGMAPGGAYFSRAPIGDDARLPVGAASPASVHGTLAPDSNRYYTLTMLDYAVYDISADGAITVNGRAYPVPAKPLGFVGGFHVLVVDRRSTAKVSDNLYSTYENLVEQYRLNTDLGRLADTQGDGVMVFLATLGRPMGDKKLPAGPPPGGCPLTAAFTVTCTYSTTKSEQQLTIPAEIVPGLAPTTVRVVLRGGKGGYAKSGGEGGLGHVVTTDIPVGAGSPVKAGTPIYVEVADHGTSGGNSDAGLAGWNGGAGGGLTSPTGTGWPGGGGGGASDIRTVPMNQPGSLDSRVVVAAGGGGAGGSNWWSYVPGGDGGTATSTGQSGDVAGGSPGTATGGGTGGPGGGAGALGLGGAGSSGYIETSTAAGGGGGGGGGWFGGGGGGSGRTLLDRKLSGGGGGGGSDQLAGGAAVVAPNEPGVKPTVTVSYAVAYGPSLQQTLRRFGATPTLVQGLAAQPRYAMVGALNPSADETQTPSFEAAEASPTIAAGATGQLQGVLVRGHRDMWFGPEASNAPVVRVLNGKTQPPTVTNYGLFDVISHVSAPWPVPAGKPGEAVYESEQKALTYLSQQVCRCDNLRDLYNSHSNLLSGWEAAVAAVPWSNGHGFDKKTMEVVQQQLVHELRDALSVAALEAGLEAIFTAHQSQLRDTFKTVEDQVFPPNVDPPKKKDLASPLVKSFLYILAALAGLVSAPFGAFVGVLATLMVLTIDLVNDHEGDNVSVKPTPPERLAEDAIKAFLAGLTTMDQTFDYVFSDWGKLSAVATAMRTDTAAWDVNGQNKGQLVNNLLQVDKLAYYRSAVPAKYGLGEGRADPSSDPAVWCKRDKLLCSFAAPASAYSFGVNSAQAAYAPRFDNLIVFNRFKDAKEWNTPLPASLMTSMQDTGLYPPYLFLRWPLKGRECIRDLINAASLQTC